MEKSTICTRCGQLMDGHSVGNLCVSCAERDIQDFNRIREYLALHPGAKMFEVSNALDLTIARIKYFLRDGRLEIIEKDNRFLKCEDCGKAICSGNYCTECERKNNSDIQSHFVGKSAQKVKYMPTK